MMIQCPKCQSLEIIPDLVLWGCDNNLNSVFAVLVNPETRQPAFKTGFRVSICGSCGYSEMHTNWAKDMLELHQKGFVTAK